MSAAAATPYASAIDADSNGIVAYAAFRHIVISSVKTPGNVHHLLPGHTDRVHVVAFVHNGNGRPVLVSGSADKTVRVWECIGGVWSCTSILSEHSLPITCVTATFQSSGVILVISGDSNGDIVAREVVLDGETRTSTSHRFTVRNLIPMALDTVVLPGSNLVLLAVSGSDKRIYIHAYTDGKMELLETLIGHSDWVRGLFFSSPFASLGDKGEVDTILLASASQDRHVRLWKFGAAVGTALAPEPFANNAVLEEGNFMTKSYRLSLQEYSADHNDWCVSLDAVLAGHEGQVMSARWLTSKSSKAAPPSRLVSASLDGTMMEWAFEQEDSLWNMVNRLGNPGTDDPGFVGAVPLVVNGEEFVVACCDKSGALRQWRRTRDGEEPMVWQESRSWTGHFDTIAGMSWEPSGKTLLTTSADQTARLWVVQPAEHDQASFMHEISRPQVHGYDFRCSPAWLGPDRFASGADEKMVRVFEAPRNYYEALNAEYGYQVVSDEFLATRASNTNVPLLGLTNKQTSDAADEKETPEATSPGDASMATIFSDEHLYHRTLWPEADKLYGHGYEMSAVAASSDGHWVASACRATKVEHAGIRVYESTPQGFRMMGEPARGHALTVTRIRFVGTGDRAQMVTCGRDRSWCVFKVRKDGCGWDLEARGEKAHARIIWDCCWVGDAGKEFVTASRDRVVKVWRRQEGGEWTCIQQQVFDSACTAVDVRTSAGGAAVMAVGLESGAVHALKQVDDGGWRLSSALLKNHAGTVTGVAWRPSEQDSLEVASCGDDRVVIVQRVTME